jgi:hypothetical protein
MSALKGPENGQMLCVDYNAEIVRLGGSLPRMFTGRYTVQSGQGLFDGRWRRTQAEFVLAAQRP